jgi:hypothetical protein
MDNLAERIANTIKIPPEKVLEYQKISLYKAIERFLPEDIQKSVIEELGLVEDPKTRQERLSCALKDIREYKDLFFQTKEGREWYLCKVRDLGEVASRAYNDAREWGRSISSNTQEQLIKLTKGRRRRYLT